MRASAAWVRDVLALSLLPVVTLAAALVGAKGPLQLALNLGPGDAPYISGFAPEYEINEAVATRWTTRRAVLKLPVALSGGPLTLSYRFARVLPMAGRLDVELSGRLVDHVSSRGGVFLERRVELGALPPTPLEVGFLTQSADETERGILLDWVRLDVGAKASTRLTGTARWRAGLVVALAIAILLAGGLAPRQALWVAAPMALAGAAGLVTNPWLTHRFLTGVPEALAVFGLAGVGLGRWMRSRGRLLAPSLAVLTAVCLVSFLARTVAVSHPDFYHPDLRTHARLVEFLQAGRFDFFLHPAKHIWEHGVWRIQAHGRTYAFPYAPTFHIPFAFLPFEYQSRITAMKLTGAAVSLVPLVLVWALARRLGIAPLGAGLMALVPTYTSRLSFAFLPALFGHAVDIGFVLWLSYRLERIREPRVWLSGVAFVAGAQLAYISGVMNLSFLLSTLALVVACGRAEDRWRQGTAIVAMGLAGSVVAVLLYYRDFLGVLVELVPRILGHAQDGVSHYAPSGWGQVAWERTRSFFGVVYPVLAALGLVRLFRLGRCRAMLAAWLLTYALLLLSRARVPDIFLHGHETLFVTPLVCLAAGDALGRLWQRGGSARMLASVLVLYLAAEGLFLQWRAIAAQLANAT